MKRKKLLTAIGLSFALLLHGFSCTGFAASTKEASEAQDSGKHRPPRRRGLQGRRLQRQMPRRPEAGF